MGGVQLGGEGKIIGVKRFQSMGKMGKNYCPHFLQPLLENVDKRSCNDGSGELIPIIHNPHRKRSPFPQAVASTLECLVGVSSKAATCVMSTKSILLLGRKIVYDSFKSNFREGECQSYRSSIPGVYPLA